MKRIEDVFEELEKLKGDIQAEFDQEYVYVDTLRQKKAELKKEQDEAKKQALKNEIEEIKEFIKGQEIKLQRLRYLAMVVSAEAELLATSKPETEPAIKPEKEIPFPERKETSPAELKLIPILDNNFIILADQLKNQLTKIGQMDEVERLLRQKGKERLTDFENYDELFSFKKELIKAEILPPDPDQTKIIPLLTLPPTEDDYPVGWIRASMVGDCPRKLLLLMQGYKPVPKPKVAAESGTALHRYFLEKLVPYGFEVGLRINSQDRRLTGEPDAINFDKKFVVELKTVGKKAEESLIQRKGYKWETVSQQLVAYSILVGMKSFKLIIYNVAARDFTAEMNLNISENSFEKMLKKIDNLLSFYEKKKLPQREIREWCQYCELTQTCEELA